MDVSGVSAGHAASLLKSTPTSVTGAGTNQTDQTNKARLASNGTTGYTGNTSTSNKPSPTQNARGQTVGSLVNTKA